MFYKVTTKVYWWFKLSWTSERLGFDQQSLLKVFFLYITKLTIKYIWRKHLFKILRDVHLWGQKHQMTTTKATTQLLNVCISCFPTTTFVWFWDNSVRRIDSWNYPKFMHKSKSSQILVPSMLLPMQKYDHIVVILEPFQDIHNPKHMT